MVAFCPPGERSFCVFFGMVYVHFIQFFQESSFLQVEKQLPGLNNSTLQPSNWFNEYPIALSNGNMLSFSFSVESGAQRAVFRYESSRKWQHEFGGY